MGMATLIIWFKKRGHIQWAEMKLMRYGGCSKADKIRNRTIRSDLNIFSI